MEDFSAFFIAHDRVRWILLAFDSIRFLRLLKMHLSLFRAHRLASHNGHSVTHLHTQATSQSPTSRSGTQGRLRRKV